MPDTLMRSEVFHVYCVFPLDRMASSVRHVEGELSSSLGRAADRFFCQSRGMHNGVKDMQEARAGNPVGTRVAGESLQTAITQKPGAQAQYSSPWSPNLLSLWLSRPSCPSQLCP